MSVQSIEPGRAQDLRFHLERAADLPNATVTALRGLAGQLDGSSVLPIVGAGTSWDCGIRVASELAQLLHDEYMADSSYADRPSDAAALRTDLGAVADAVFLERDQRELVRLLGLDDQACWPDADDLASHFCGYRVLARLAREDFFSEAVTFNYDCAFERGLQDEGFMFSPYAPRGRQWRDHATVVADAKQNASVERRGAFSLTKAHGCARRLRHELAAGGPSPEETIVLRWSQLLDWRNDLWARDLLADRARRHVLLLLGFSGQDPVVHAGLTRVLEEIHGVGAAGQPRVLVFDRDPEKLSLKLLRKAGLGDSDPPPGVVTTVGCGSPATLTAILLAFLAELLAFRLKPVLSQQSVALPAGIESRVALLCVAAPAMLRWSFLLRPPNPQREYAQRVNLEQAAERGYVPLTADPHASAHAIGLRRRVRQLLALSPDDAASEVHDADGFLRVPARGQAYLPVSVRAEDLKAIQRRMPALDKARGMLPYPRHLDGILVTTSGDDLVGVSIETGREVSVP